MSDKQEQARRMYEANKAYVEKNIDKLSWRECYEFAKQQDRLYLRMVG